MRVIYKAGDLEFRGKVGSPTLDVFAAGAKVPITVTCDVIRTLTREVPPLPGDETIRHESTGELEMTFTARFRKGDVTREVTDA